MRTLFLFFVATVLLYSCRNNSEQPVENNVQTSVIKKDSFFLLEDTVYSYLRGLYAMVDGKIISIIDTAEHKYINIMQEIDYDKDNDTDLLMLYSENGGGNCCPSPYFLVTNEGNGKFIRSEMTEPAWKDPVFETWKGQISFVIKSNNEGTNNDDYEETDYRYVVNNGQIHVAEALKLKEMPAITEIRAKIFSFENVNEVHDLVFDLDNDKINDTIRCSFWDRWGRMRPHQIIFSTGLKDSSEFNAKRIGVLSSETNGVHDLVIDLNQVLKWNGGAYEYIRNGKL